MPKRNADSSHFLETQVLANGTWKRKRNPGRPDDEIKAYNLYLTNWIVLAAMALFVCIAFPICGVSLALDDEFWGVLCFSIVLLVAGHFFLSRNKSRLGFAIISIAQLGLLSIPGALLTYVAASADLPLQDAMLSHWDRMFGLNWATYYEWMTAWPALLPYISLAYAAIALPPFGVPIVLALTNNLVRLQRYTMATLLTLGAVAFISALMPAIGTYQLYNLPTEFSTYKASGYLIQLARLPVIRSGGLHILHIAQIGGIVTFRAFTRRRPSLPFGPGGVCGGCVRLRS